MHSDRESVQCYWLEQRSDKSQLVSSMYSLYVGFLYAIEMYYHFAHTHCARTHDDATCTQTMDTDHVGLTLIIFILIFLTHNLHVCSVVRNAVAHANKSSYTDGIGWHTCFKNTK